MFYYICQGHISLDEQYFFLMLNLRGQLKVIFHDVAKLPTQDAVLPLFRYKTIIIILQFYIRMWYPTGKIEPPGRH